MLELLSKEIITENDIKELISLNVEESIHLDFKQGDSLGNNDKKKSELAKDVSAFANSAGGCIIYGIIEKNHIADSFSFVDGNEITKEWIEQVIQSRIQRKIEGLKIHPIRFDNNVKTTIYVISIPESSFAPHMTSEKRFYKRFNFESVQMEEYEIRNLYNRKERTNLKIHEIILSKDIMYENQGTSNQIEYHSFGFQIENIGSVIEKYFKLIITVDFSYYSLKEHIFSSSKVNHVLMNDNKRAFIFSNSSPIFPEEIMTIGNLWLGFPSIQKNKLINDEKLKLQLIYTNGKDEFEIDFGALIPIE